MKRGIVITLIVLAVALGVLLLFTYEVIGIDWLSFMEDQPSIRYQEGPRRLSPADSVSAYRSPALDSPTTLTNPVPADDVSLQRGEILFGLHCSVCHGTAGQGDGPVTNYWLADARRPANLSDARIKAYPDSLFYRVVTQGLGAMPPMRENLTERQVWDVINYVRTLP